MLASIFVTSGGLPVDAVLFVVASCVLERRAGLLRAAGIPLAGHVIATLVTEGGVRVAIWHHALPRTAAWQLDIGVSYVAFTAAAAAAAYIPRRAARVAAVAVLCAWTARPLFGDAGDMTSWGHVICVLIGLVCQHWLPVSRHAARRERLLAIRRGMAAATVAGLAAVGVVLVAGGTQLIPAAGAPVSRPAAQCAVGLTAEPGARCERRAGSQTRLAAAAASPVHRRLRIERKRSQPTRTARRPASGTRATAPIRRARREAVVCMRHPRRSTRLSLPSTTRCHCHVRPGSGSPAGTSKRRRPQV